MLYLQKPAIKSPRQIQHYKTLHQLKVSNLNLSFLLLFISFFSLSQNKNDVMNNDVRNEIINGLIGTWILKEKLDSDYNSNIKFTKFIAIDLDQISFLNDSKVIISRIDLKNNKFTTTSFSAFPSLQIDKEIWYFSVRKVNGQQRLRLIKQVDKNGNLVGRIDDRGSIINRKARKKALKKEIYTYYIKK